jgi:SnoaL-like domain
MSDGDDVMLWCALNRLIADYWAEVDENGGRRAHEFYEPEGLYAVGNSRFEGRDKIEAFYARRRYAAVVTRHIVTNLRAFGDNEPYARMAGVMSLYRADGKSPFQGARPPAMIADFEARCVRGDDRRWRFQSHVLRPFIVGSDMPASITIKPQELSASGPSR